MSHEFEQLQGPRKANHSVSRFRVSRVAFFFFFFFFFFYRQLTAIRDIISAAITVRQEDFEGFKLQAREGGYYERTISSRFAFHADVATIGSSIPAVLHFGVKR